MQHKLIHTTDTTNCDICNKNFANKIKLQKHIDYVHSEKMFSCMECKKIFSSKQNLETHQHGHKGQNKEECSICFNKEFIVLRSVRQKINKKTLL